MSHNNKGMETYDLQSEKEQDTHETPHIVVIALLHIFLGFWPN